MKITSAGQRQNSTSIPTHFIETPYNVIINTQIHDREFRPLRLSIQKNNISNKNLFYEQLDLYSTETHTQVTEPGYKSYLRDSEDKDIFYIIDTVTVKKIKKQDDGTFEILKSASPTGGNIFNYNYAYNKYKFIGQSPEYIVVCNTGNGDNGNGGGCRYKMLEIIRINKTDFTCAYAQRGNCIDGALFTIDTIGFDIWTLLVWNGGLYIRKYNISQNVYVNVWQDETSAGRTKSCGISNIVKMKDKYYVLTTDTTNVCYRLIELDIDFANETVVANNCMLQQHESFIYHTMEVLGRDNMGWLSYTLHVIDDKYIAITSHDEKNESHMANNSGAHASTLFSSRGWHNHVVFEKIDDNSFEYVTHIPFNASKHLYGVMYYDNYTTVLYGNDQISFYIFNPETKKYSNTYNIQGVYNCIGIDEQKRFYYIDTVNKIQYLTINTPCNASVFLENNNYEYNGVDINTNLTVICKNFKGEFISIKYNITIDGNAFFASNNSKTITVNSNDGITTIPITINGYGLIDFYIEEV